MKKTTEEKIAFYSDKDVFYNPVMKLNRDISIWLLNSIENKNMQIALPMTASGIRGIRFLKELKKGKIKNITFNDKSEKAIKLIKKNLKLNDLKHNKKVEILNKDANIFILEKKGFDYIDIDPFGSPNKFLDTSIRRLARNGILAVTATDTAPLAGTYIKACRRKYWAEPTNGPLKHEIGLRILIRKIQLIGAQYEKALIPIFSYSKNHYFRIFFKCNKGKKKVDKMMKEIGKFEEFGPLWTGKLFDKKLVKKMLKESNGNGFLEQINKELDILCFYDLHYLCSKKNLNIPKSESVIEAIKKSGHKASRTHFSYKGIKTDLSEKEFLKLVKKLVK